MKNTLLAIVSIFGLFASLSVSAGYNDCTSQNNFCGGTVYRCDVYCSNGSYNAAYCMQNCNGWNNNYGSYYTNNLNYYSNNSNCYYDAFGSYRCDGQNYNTNNYTNNYSSSYWYPSGYFFWSQEDLNIMTKVLNTDYRNKTVANDFFESRVISKDNNWKRLNAINIKNVSIRDGDVNNKLEDSKKFLSGLKDAIWQRYTEGTIKNYQMADIIRNLSDTMYYLNTYFGNVRQYERTGNDLYNELSMGNLDDVKTNYDRLKGSLRWRNW